MIGEDRTFLSKLENGYRKAPSIMMLSKICQKLCISIDDLFLITFGDGDEVLSLVISDINAYINAHNYDMAYEIAEKYLKDIENAYYRQFYLFAKAVYFLNKDNYQQAEFLVEEAINLTTSLTGHLYTLTELRLVNMFIYINLVKFERDFTPIMSKTFNNYIEHLMLVHSSEYSVIGHLYLDCCYYYLSIWDFDSFIKTYKPCEKIFIDLGLKNHLKEGWYYMYIYHYFKDEKEEAEKYFDKLKTFSELFNDNSILDTFNETLKIFNNRWSKIKKRLSSLFEIFFLTKVKINGNLLVKIRHLRPQISASRMNHKVFCSILCFITSLYFRLSICALKECTAGPLPRLSIRICNKLSSAVFPISPPIASISLTR